MASSTATVFPIPDEITEHALTFLHPLDVANFSQTCHLAYTLVYGAPDQYLWRRLFLAYPFDDPRNALSYQNTSSSYNWRAGLQCRVQAELIALNIAHRLDEQQSALETFISVIGDASPVPSTLENKKSDSIKWVTRILYDSKILDARVAVPGATDNQLVCRIRTYLALSFEGAKDDETSARLGALRTRSRCLVYDLRNYRRDNDYGPFLCGGQINWIQAEAIVNVIQTNLMELHDVWMDTRPPVGFEATRAYSVTGAASRPEADWACVEGTWRRYVCFMDYRDLFAFNYSSNSRGTRDPSFFDTPNFQEATRLIELKLHLVPVSSIPHSYVFISPRKSSRSPRFPDLYFSGTSNGINGNEATVKGSVSMGGDGVVRWRFASIYDGHTQWSSEGIQVGNVGSASGIIGSWTGATHDHGDPVGPFWLWKVPDDHPSHMSDPN